MVAARPAPYGRDRQVARHERPSTPVRMGTTSLRSRSRQCRVFIALVGLNRGHTSSLVERVLVGDRSASAQSGRREIRRTKGVVVATEIHVTSRQARTHYAILARVSAGLRNRPDTAGALRMDPSCYPKHHVGTLATRARCRLTAFRPDPIFQGIPGSCRPR